MACSKYSLTNTGGTIQYFNYRRCDDNAWNYQVDLQPGQTKNIWLINGTFSSAFQNIVINSNVFPITDIPIIGSVIYDTAVSSGTGVFNFTIGGESIVNIPLPSNSGGTTQYSVYGANTGTISVTTDSTVLCPVTLDLTLNGNQIFTDTFPYGTAYTHTFNLVYNGTYGIVVSQPTSCP